MPPVAITLLAAYLAAPVPLTAEDKAAILKTLFGKHAKVAIEAVGAPDERSEAVAHTKFGEILIEDGSGRTEDCGEAQVTVEGAVLAAALDSAASSQDVWILTATACGGQAMASYHFDYGTVRMHRGRQGAGASDWAKSSDYKFRALSPTIHLITSGMGVRLGPHHVGFLQTGYSQHQGNTHDEAFVFELKPDGGIVDVLDVAAGGSSACQKAIDVASCASTTLRLQITDRATNGWNDIESRLTGTEPTSDNKGIKKVDRSEIYRYLGTAYQATKK